MTLELQQLTTGKSESKLNESYEKAIREQVEIEKCSLSPKYFLSQYMWLQNKNTARTVKWQEWDYLVDLLEIFQKFHEILIVKARQLGVTWTATGGYGLWKSLFSDSAKALYLSQGEEEAWDMISKARFVWSHLPDFMRPPLKHDTRSFIDWTVNNSEIKALPSTDKAGRGTDATIIIRDEVAYHPYGELNFSAISPAIDSGGQLIDLSTMDKLAVDNHFTERVLKLYQGATKNVMPSGIEVYTRGDSKSVLLFLGWKLRPTRMEGLGLDEWFELYVKPKYEALKIEQEYPATIEQALAAPDTEAFFDRLALSDMLNHVEPPISQVKDFNTLNGIIKVWKLPVIGERYVVFTDPSDGFDPFATIVMNARTGEWVAIANSTLPAEECAQVHDSLVRFYNNAFNAGEVNAKAGGKFELTIKTLNTPNISQRRDAQGKIMFDKGGIPKYNWYTTEPIRDLALHDYKEAVYKRLIIIHDRDAINEHKEFIRIDGKPQARRGCHDDIIMAGAGAWQLQKFVPLGEYGVRSHSYR